MAKFAVATVEATGVGLQKPFHSVSEVSLRGLANQVKMIAHEAVRMDLPTGFFAYFSKRFQEAFAVEVIQKDGLTPVAAIHDMVNCAWVLESKFSGHAR